MNRIKLIGGISILFLILFFSFKLKGRRNQPNRSLAQSHAEDIGAELLRFETDFGRFPDSSTIAKVAKNTSPPFSLGDHSSNALFRQLLAMGRTGELPFWASTGLTPRRPDDVFSSDTTALAPRECAFSYIAGLSSKGDPNTPVVVCPLIPGTTRFDPKPFKGKAIILRLDLSARAEPIDKSGNVIVNGMPIFDPRQPFWKGKAPDIKWPE